MISQSELIGRLNYDPITGWFNSGSKLVGSYRKNGYLSVVINRKSHLLHRLAFLFMTGAFPSNDVDHINGLRDDNRWCNLREATRSQNLKNRTKNISKTLPKNIYQQTNSNKYRVRIKVDGIKIHGGYFIHLEDAVKKATEMRQQYFGEYARHI